MPASGPTDGDADRRAPDSADADVLRRLGAALRDLRTRAGKSGRAVAADLGWSQTKVSRIETGVVRPSVSDVDALLAVLSAQTRDLDQLRGLAEQAQQVSVSWRGLHRGGLARRQHELVQLERTAVEILHFQPALVPGLLQTPEYARLVLELANVTSQQDVEAAVGARLARQAVLFENDGPRHRFVLTEAALRWRPGSWHVLRTQLDRVSSMAQLPSVDLRVLPWTTRAPTIAGHAFRAFVTAAGLRPSLALVETITSESSIFGDEELSLYATTFARLCDAALNTEDSLTYIREVAMRLPS